MADAHRGDARDVSNHSAIGFVNSEPDPAVPLDTITIPEDHRLHCLVVGSSGYGKSTTLKLLIRQNLVRGDGVAVLDPHHDLAAWTALRIPRRRANHLVYISPAQLSRTGRAIPINPLEAYGGAPATAATTFAETLLKAFDTRGVQMHQILREAATSLIASNRGGLGLLRRIILDKSERDAVLADVNIQDNLDFWNAVFPKLQREAVTHVDNKITPITSNPAVGPFFEGRTTFDMARLIDGNGILVFDGAGCNNDGERMLFTTFLLNMITAAASGLMQSRPQGTRPKRFYLYVDEMQMLESGKLKEMLQQVRKWGIRMTLATQQLESIDAGNAAAMVGNCDLYLASRCTQATAKLLSPKMCMKPDELAQIPKFHLNFHMSLPDGDIHGRLLRTRDMDRAAKSWDTLERVVDRSLLNYGVDVDMKKYTNESEHAYDVSPLEMAVLSVLYHVPGGLDRDAIHAAVARFAAGKRRVAQLLGHLARSGLVDAVSGASVAYRLRPAAVDRYFDTAALKGRAGGDLHIRTLAALQDHYSRRGYYTRMDTGSGTVPQADLEVCEPAVGPTGEPDQARWGRRVAIEVETGPSRHPNKPGEPGQVYVNWQKSCRTMRVWFLVYAEKDMRVIGKQMAELGVGPDMYHTTLISADDVLEGGAVPLPPDFVPVDPLPYCATDAALDRIILDMVQAGGLPVSRLRRLLPATYKDGEIAEAVARLEAGGRLVQRRLKGGAVLEEE